MDWLLGRKALREEVTELRAKVRQLVEIQQDSPSRRRHEIHMRRYRVTNDGLRIQIAELTSLNDNYLSKCQMLQKEVDQLKSRLLGLPCMSTTPAAKMAAIDSVGNNAFPMRLYHPSMTPSPCGQNDAPRPVAGGAYCGGQPRPLPAGDSGTSTQENWRACAAPCQPSALAAPQPVAPQPAAPPAPLPVAPPAPLPVAPPAPLPVAPPAPLPVAPPAPLPVAPPAPLPVAPPAPLPVAPPALLPASLPAPLLLAPQAAPLSAAGEPQSAPPLPDSIRDKLIVHYGVKISIYFDSFEQLCAASAIYSLEDYGAVSVHRMYSRLFDENGITDYELRRAFGEEYGRHYSRYLKHRTPNLVSETIGHAMRFVARVSGQQPSQPSPVWILVSAGRQKMVEAALNNAPGISLATLAERIHKASRRAPWYSLRDLKHCADNFYANAYTLSRPSNQWTAWLARLAVHSDLSPREWFALAPDACLKAYLDFCEVIV